MSASYSDTMEAVGEAYEPLMKAFLERVREACDAAGMTSEPDLTDTPDCYRWDLIVWRPGESGDERSVAVSAEILEERPDFGIADDAWGIAFRLAVHGWGGRFIGEYQPGNFTEDCWTDGRDPLAVGERWALFAGIGIESIPGKIIRDRGGD